MQSKKNAPHASPVSSKLPAPVYVYRMYVHQGLAAINRVPSESRRDARELLLSTWDRDMGVAPNPVAHAQGRVAYRMISALLSSPSFTR